jgi:Protein of unknown function (DUF669)
MSEDGNDGVKKLLGSMQGAWARERERAAGEPPPKVKKFEPLPLGKYHVIIEKAELTRTKSGEPKPMLVWELVVKTGAYRGMKEWYNQIISTQSLEYVLQNLRLCGIDVPDISEVASYLPQARGVELEISIKEKGGRRTVWFNHRLGDESHSEEEIEKMIEATDLPV